MVDKHGWEDDWFNVPVSNSTTNPSAYPTAGNKLALRLVVDGLKLQPCSPSFVDARDAILLADKVNTNGENQCEIWKAFAKRGLGISAQANGRENFELPEECKSEKPEDPPEEPPEDEDPDHGDPDDDEDHGDDDEEYEEHEEDD